MKLETEDIKYVKGWLPKNIITVCHDALKGIAYEIAIREMRQFGISSKVVPTSQHTFGFFEESISDSDLKLEPQKIVNFLFSYAKEEFRKSNCFGKWLDAMSKGDASLIIYGLEFMQKVERGLL